MPLTPTQLSELQTIVLDLGDNFPSSDDALWESAIRIQKAGLGPVTGPGGQPVFDALVASIVTCADDIATVQGRQGGPGNSLSSAVFQEVPVEDNLPSGTVGGVIYLGTAPNTYAFTDVVELLPAGPNSVILSEIGTQVARTVPAASGGLEINNLSTGGGFERALTTSDSFMPPAAADDMLFASAPNVFTATSNMQWNETNRQMNLTNLAAANPVLVLTQDQTQNIMELNINGANTGGIRFETTQNSAYTIWDCNDSTGGNGFRLNYDPTLSSPNHELELIADDFGTLFEFENEGNMYFRGNEASGILALTIVGNGEVRIRNGATTYMEEIAAAQADVANFGQLWVRNDTPNVLVFTDDVGTDTVLGAAAPAGTTEGDMIAWDGVSSYRVATGVRMPATGIPPAADEGFITLEQTGTVDVRRSQIFHNTQSTQSVAQFFETAADDGFFLRIVGNGSDRIAWGREVTSVDTDMFSIREDSTIRIETGGDFMMTERAAARASIATLGQLWVRNDTPNNLVFTDDAGTDFVIGGAGASLVTSFEGRTGAVVATVGDYADVAETFSALQTFTATNPAIVIQAASAALRLSETGGTADEGNWLWRANADILRLQTADDASPNSGVDQPLRFFRTGTSMDEIIIGDTPLVTINQEANAVTDLALGESTTLRGNSQGGRLLLYGEEASAITVVTVQNSGTQAQIALPTGVGFQMSGDGAYNAQFRDGATISIFDTDDSDSMSLSHNGTHGVQTSTGDGIRLNVPLYMQERAAAAADTATLGQLWVRNDTPNVLVFTDDAGTDFVLNAAAGVSNPMTADLDGDGFNLDDMGVMFMREQASADADVSTQGQLWVRTEVFSNTLMFTNDNGNDFVVAGLVAQGDMSAGSVTIAGTTFVAVANVGPRPNSEYSFIAHVEVTAPAADDMLIQITADTNTQLKSVLTASDGTISELESTTGEVITNNVLVTTDGSASPDGTYVAIQGIIVTGATGQTLSLRCAKNADTGADGFAVRGTIQLFPVNPV